MKENKLMEGMIGEFVGLLTDDSDFWSFATIQGSLEGFMTV